MLNNANNPEVLYFLDFVERLPLSEDQKMEFVQEHIQNVKKAEKQKKQHRERFKSVVLKELLADRRRITI